MERARQIFARPLRTATGKGKLGLALGGGFARGNTHIGVLRVLERNRIPVHVVAGVSAGSIAAAAYASGAQAMHVEQIAHRLRLWDVAGIRLSLMGLAGNERMEVWLRELLPITHFESMRIPLGIVATDLLAGKPHIFRNHGDVLLPIRASCAYPGLYQPVRNGSQLLVDGMVTMEVPALAARQLGATHVISVAVPNPMECDEPQNLVGVVSRCFSILNSRCEKEWMDHTDVVIAPDVGHLPWDAFDRCDEMIAAGEKAAEAALPAIERLLRNVAPVADRRRTVVEAWSNRD